MLTKLFWMFVFAVSIILLYHLTILERNIYCDVYVDGYRFYGKKLEAISVYSQLKTYLFQKPYLNHTNPELEKYKVDYFFPSNYTEYFICKSGNWLQNGYNQTR